jgi:hypothetical protein
VLTTGEYKQVEDQQSELTWESAHVFLPEKNSMWFKTRIGLVSVNEPLEIRVAEYPKAKKPSYLVYARSLYDTDVSYKGIFGTLRAPGRFAHLAQFDLSDSSKAAIAQCMKLIGDAIASDARICDLSAVGHAEAWPDGWNLIEW